MQFIADIVLSTLKDQFLAGAREWNGQGLMPRPLDELSYACLLFVEEYHDHLGPLAVDHVEACRAAAYELSIHRWLDETPWLAAQYILSHDGDSAARSVSSSLANADSSLRFYFHELAWLIKSRLDRGELTPDLLQNAADKLGSWDLSLGLCYTLFESEDEFWPVADAFQCQGPYDPQYRQRLKDVRNLGITHCLLHFYDLERRLRKMICDLALQVKLPQSGPADGQLSLFDEDAT